MALLIDDVWFRTKADAAEALDVSEYSITKRIKDENDPTEIVTAEEIEERGIPAGFDEEAEESTEDDESEDESTEDEEAEESTEDDESEEEEAASEDDESDDEEEASEGSPEEVDEVEEESEPEPKPRPEPAPEPRLPETKKSVSKKLENMPKGLSLQERIQYILNSMN